MPSKQRYQRIIEMTELEQKGFGNYLDQFEKKDIGLNVTEKTDNKKKTKKGQEKTEEQKKKEEEERKKKEEAEKEEREVDLNKYAQHFKV